MSKLPVFPDPPQEPPEAKAARVARSIYRNSRDIVESAAIDQTRRGDKTGDKRGVFLAGLSACALGAGSAAEALPFLRRLAQEGGEPGWVLAQTAINADSAPYLEALAELGMVDLATEKIWSGYETTEGEACRDHACAEAALHHGSGRCLSYLMGVLPTAGMLALAAKSRHRGVFELALERARADGDQPSIDQALAEVCDTANRRGRSHGLVDSMEAASALIAAGGRLGHPAGAPKGWSSWNGASVGEIETAWVPALRLAEPEEALPATASRSGTMDGPAFFGLWSSACLLARSAVEGGRGEEGERTLALASGWEMARAPGSPLLPIAALAMASPTGTDSGLRREVLDTVQIILASTHLDQALRDEGPLSLARCAIGRWLWGDLASPPAPSDKPKWRPDGMAPDPLVREISEACSRLGVRPLGPIGAVEAAQEFVGRLRFFGEAAYAKTYEPTHEDPRAKEARLAQQAQREAEQRAGERAAATHLAALMPRESGALLLATVDACHAQGKLPDPTERAVAKERAILGLGRGAASSRRSMSI